MSRPYYVFIDFLEIEAQYFLISNLAEYSDFVFFRSSGELFHNFEASYLKESFVNIDPLFRTSVLF